MEKGLKFKSLREIHGGHGEVLEAEKIKPELGRTSARSKDDAGSMVYLKVGSDGNLSGFENGHFSRSESGLKEQLKSCGNMCAASITSQTHSEHVAFPRATKAGEISDEVLKGKTVLQCSSSEVDFSASSESGACNGGVHVGTRAPSSNDLFSGNAAFRASNGPEDVNNALVVKDSSPKSTVCSNKSDLTEISCLRNSLCIKDERPQSSEEQVESSQPKPISVATEGDLAENCLDQEKRFEGSTSVLGKSKHQDNGSNALEQEVNICDICGVLGREELLAVCTRCGDGAEHIYCMRVKLDKVPDGDWLCEDCKAAEEAEKQKNDGLEKDSSLKAVRHELQSENESAVDRRNGLESDEKGLSIDKRSKDRVDSHLATKRPLDVSEAILVNPTRVSKKGKTHLSRDLSVKESDKGEIMAVNAVSQQRTVGVSPTFAASSSRISSISGGSKKRITHLSRVMSGKESDKGKIMAAEAVSQQRTAALSPHCAASTPRISSISGGSVPNSRPFKNADAKVKVEQPRSNRQNLLLKDASHPIAAAVPSAFSPSPQPQSIWRGGFKIHRKGKFSSLYDGIQAYLSSSSKDMLELVHEFPQNVLLEEKSVSTVWPSHFSKDHVTVDKIGVYFFAKDLKSYECSYQSLLEYMIINGICLMGNVGGAELLIFTSYMLPEGLQRWNGLLYLWGISRGQKVVSRGSSQTCDILQREGEGFDGQQANPNPECQVESTVPNLELSLGPGGPLGGNKRPELTPFRMKKSSESSLALSLSLSLPGSSLGERTAETDGGVDTSLSLFSGSIR